MLTKPAAVKASRFLTKYALTRHVDRVAAYIARQQEHHRKKTFGQEFELFAKKYGLQWGDE